ncbi:2-(1,2-epoxy-1,2-dihydrophenyl)acetyl-CoA isomerase [Haloechinothrix alba]|uniref:2-(1,2-epoxy-1,2-dihydrophenyl)acetyl-CoA isomerase n=1 Tax=Haloechinothrix alba TaxID=664784 RepID=A0A238ZHK7_9PSEU|nr:enoyl-CoA hydratase-related protein [Haloechinothrix alba]SNR82632.1 2-(1,2-epoxy-1,2-dihydrophenyl)acetyl-CoA isomerase [Haloechinothrix alba]
MRDETGGDAVDSAPEHDRPVDKDRAVAIASGLYDALSRGASAELDELLHPDFTGCTTDGLPLELGGRYEGPEAMRREFWGRIAAHYVATAEPDDFALLDDGRLLVTGRYTGHARNGGTLDAGFAHVLSFVGGRISDLVQLTDSERWRSALPEQDDCAPAVDYTVSDGLGIVRLNRPDVRNAIDQRLADELAEVSRRCAADSELRAVLLMGNGPAFTVGGDIAEFARVQPEELPGLLRAMVTPYHDAIRTFCSLEVPVVTAVHGSVGGGGLGLLYCADIALAAEGTKFATGFCGLGLSGDGGSSWFLPRLVGPRRAAELYFEERVLDARESVEWGLVNRTVAADGLEREAMSTARRLARGPTRAYGQIRQLLWNSWSSSLPHQLAAEIEALARTGGTEDAAGAARSFIHKSTTSFQGR